MKNCVIYGCGGHGRVVLDACRAAGVAVIGWIDDQASIRGRVIDGVVGLGTLEDLPKLYRGNCVHCVLLGIGDNSTRMLAHERLRQSVDGIGVLSVAHPSATVSHDCILGPGAVVLAGSVVNPGCTVGEGCVINTRASLDHDSVLREFSSLGPGVTTGGEVVVGARSSICIGAILLERIRVGSDAVVGAGAVVVRDIPDGVVAYGVPARIIRRRVRGEPFLARGRD